MKKKFLLCLFQSGVLLGCFSVAHSQPVKIVYENLSPQATYAANMLGKALRLKGYTLNNANAAIVIVLSKDAKKQKEEAYNIHADGKQLTVTGGDERGLLYGSLSLAEELRNGTRLEQGSACIFAIALYVPTAAT